MAFFVANTFFFLNQGSKPLQTKGIGLESGCSGLTFWKFSNQVVKMKTIIAPTDFSNSSKNAVYYAADLAESMSALLVLLNVVEVPVAASEIPVAESVFDGLVNLAGQDLDRLKTEVYSRCKGNLEINSKVIMGNVATGIKEFSEELHPFAIVMGKKEGNSMARILLGSSTLSTVKHNPYPILIIPDHIRFKGFHKIGLACDLRNVIETIPFKLLDDWLSVFSPTLDIIHISKHERDFKSLNVAESISLENHLNKFKPKFNFLTGDKLVDQLNDFASEHQLDLLIVVPKKHGFLALFDKNHVSEIIIYNNMAILSIQAS